MRLESYPVTEEQINARPSRGRICFYCSQPVGAEHKPDCAMRKRTVVIKMTLEYVVDVPEHWTKENIEFHRNDGTWCSDNALGELEELSKYLETSDKGCLCSAAEFEYLREATTEDEERYGVFADEKEAV